MPTTNAESYEYQERKRCIAKMDKILENLPEYCSRFLYHQLNGAKKLQPRTALAYAGDLNLFFYFLAIANPACKNIPAKDVSTDILAKLSVDDIEEYYEWLADYERDGKTYTNGAAAQKRKIASVSAMYRYLMQKHYLEVNPCALMDFTRLSYKPIIALTDNQQTKFLNALGTPINDKSEKIKEKYTALRDIAIAYTFLGTGMRVSELVAINMEDLDMDDRYFIITRKGGKIQQIYFGKEVSDALQAYLTESRPKILPDQDSPDATALFLSLQHRRISVRQVENIIKDTARTALPPSEAEHISCHKLRSTFGTRLLTGSGSIALVAEVLGHADISTTKKRYSAVQNIAQAPDFVDVMPKKEEK